VSKDGPSPIIQAGLVEAAVRAHDLARKNVAAEQQKYELGTITAFEVLGIRKRALPATLSARK
jgi:outer membrane protein TolC